MNENAIILSQPGNPRCPVQSFKLYLPKLISNKYLFQAPDSKHKTPKDQWYKNTPVGINTLGKFMKEISHAAGLNYIYTNHCIHGTTASAMKNLVTIYKRYASLPNTKALKV